MGLPVLASQLHMPGRQQRFEFLRTFVFSVRLSLSLPLISQVGTLSPLHQPEGKKFLRSGEDNPRTPLG